MAEGNYAIAADVTCFVTGPARYEGSERAARTVTAVAHDLSLPGPDASSPDAALFDMDNPLVKLVEARTCPASSQKAITAVCKVSGKAGYS
ncbi:hypothetical protein CCR95_01365 [Thiocystis minor]|uniref:hypothetical protein n=1 Tax=Thiocystis minor TaxID=61597 RepID=UPI001912A144|nr:hypothetical protein [Thiocystis minor]MBK5962779.1 hypothetical protein [Thiocystis minor]